MMYPFISQVSRHFLSKPPVLAVRHLGGRARFLSKTTLCHIVGAEECEDGDIGELVICNFSASSCGTKYFRGDRPLNKDFLGPGCGDELLEKTVPMDLMKENGTIGASHGWVATLKDGVIRLQDDLNPSASDLEPKRVSLPPLVTLPHCQTQLVTNVAMSSTCPEDEEDCIVAVKFVGPQLSLCRPASKNPEWVNIRIEDPGFFFSSRVMYSKKDNMFSMLGSGGLHMGSWGLENHKSQNLRFTSGPKLHQTDWEILNRCRRHEYLVESPTGQTFIVMWYTYSYLVIDKVRTLRFVVFEILENEVAMCTKDIGDLCIFLSSKGEPFCLQASLYGLSPNCIYYLGGHEFGKVNLGDDEKRFCRGDDMYPAPYFIPPQS